MASKTKKAIKISQKHLLGIQDLSINDVNLILNESQSFIKLNQSKNKRLNVLNGKLKLTYFLNLPQEHKVHLN
jgi:aspartate carbamoyltransferase catalytic subunit